MFKEAQYGGYYLDFVLYDVDFERLKNPNLKIKDYNRYEIDISPEQDFSNL